MNVSVASNSLIFALVLILASQPGIIAMNTDKLNLDDVPMPDAPLPRNEFGELIFMNSAHLIIAPSGDDWHIGTDPEATLTDRNKRLHSFKVNNVHYNVIGLSFRVGADREVCYKLLKLSKLKHEFAFAAVHETTVLTQGHEEILSIIHAPNSGGFLEAVDADIRAYAAKGVFQPAQKSLATPRQKSYNHR